MKASAFNITLWLLSLAILFFLLTPVFIVAVSSFSSSDFLQFPPDNFGLRWHKQFWQSDAWLAAIFNSLKIGVVAGLASVVISVMVLTITHKYSRPVKLAILTFFSVPLICPPIVMALAQLQFFNRYGIDSGVLRLALAHSAICISVSYIMLYSIFDGALRSKIAMSIDLSKSIILVLSKVVFPLLFIQILGVFIVAFLISFDEPVISQMLATPGIETIPQKTYNSIRYDIAPDAAVLTFYVVIFWAFIGLLVAYFTPSLDSELKDG